VDCLCVDSSPAVKVARHDYVWSWEPGNMSGVARCETSAGSLTFFTRLLRRGA